MSQCRGTLARSCALATLIRPPASTLHRSCRAHATSHISSNSDQRAVRIGTFMDAGHHTDPLIHFDGLSMALTFIQKFGQPSEGSLNQNPFVTHFLAM